MLTPSPSLSGALGEPSKAKLAQQLGMLLYNLAPKANVVYVQGDNSSFVPHVSIPDYAEYMRDN